MFKRVIVKVLDSIGIGLFLPTMGNMGLVSIEQIDGVEKQHQSIRSFGNMAEISKGMVRLPDIRRWLDVL